MKGATNIPQFVALLEKPALVWLMCRPEDATESMVNKFAAFLKRAIF